MCHKLHDVDDAGDKVKKLGNFSNATSSLNIRTQTYYFSVISAVEIGVVRCMLMQVLLNFLVTVKAVPHEFVNRTDG